MVDLVWRCVENDDTWQTFFDDKGEKIIASTSGCPCDMFTFNGSCEHVAFMREHFCTWRSDGDHAPALASVVSPEEPRCPVCGGHVAVAEEVST